MIKVINHHHSASRKRKIVDDIVAEYGHIIIDECHHLAPFTFEQLRT